MPHQCCFNQDYYIYRNGFLQTSKEAFNAGFDNEWGEDG